MGNTCAGPKQGKNGFFQSMTAAVWKPKESLPDQDSGDSTNNKDNPDVQSAPPTPIEIKPEDPKKPDPPPETTTNDAAKQNKPAHVKTASCAGLQVESVLQRKTENVKEKFTMGRKLGQGQFGTTFLCVEKGTNKEFACKTIAKRKLATPEDVADVRTEIQIMHHLAGHPNVISIVGAFEDAVAVHLMMELCAGGELFDRIIQRGHYTERKAAELSRINSWCCASLPFPRSYAWRLET